MTSKEDTLYQWWQEGGIYPLFELSIFKWSQDFEIGYSYRYNKSASPVIAFASIPEFNPTTVYPNPASTEFVVSGAEKMHSLTSSTGREVQFDQIYMSNGFLRILVKDASPGIYTAIIEVRGELKHVKISIV
ncbi:MAG: T9SS type A sorting domain-containing protein [Cytophagaceae bacterium]